MIDVSDEADALLPADRKVLLENLRAVKDVLLTLSANADEEILIQERLLLISQCRSTSLPNDILAHIFELACDLDERPSFAVAISSVCRRFREIAQRLPRLWAYVSNEQSPEALHAYLTLSREMGLNVRIFFGQETTPEFLDAIVAHAHRWEDLRVGLDAKLPVDFWNDWRVMDQLGTRLSGLLLPRLITLHVPGNDDDDLDDPSSKTDKYNRKVTVHASYAWDLAAHVEIPGNR